MHENEVDERLGGSVEEVQSKGSSWVINAIAGGSSGP